MAAAERFVDTLRRLGMAITWESAPIRGSDAVIVLTEKPDIPGVLGLGVSGPRCGEAAVALDVDEAQQLHTALGAWPDEQ